MRKIEVPRSKLSERGGERILQVREVDIRLESDQIGTVSVVLYVPDSPEALVVPLAPPAAMQLGKQLRQAVKTYLREPAVLDGPEKE